MKEAEAKTKWCPFVRQGFYLENTRSAAIAVNRDPRMEGSDGKCIGSECMAWRWRTMTDVDTLGRPRVADDDNGYCGLAGKP